MSSSNKKATDRAALAASMRAEQARREARRRVLAIGGVALAFILIVGGAIVYSVVKNNHDNKLISHAATSDAAAGYGVVLGPDDAKHKVVIYEDFLCPICGALEQGSEDQLAKLASEGKVQVEYRPFNLLGGNDENSYSVRAAGAFSIVLKDEGSAIAMKFHNLLYHNQPNEQGPYPANDELVKLAVQAGASEAKVKSQIESNAGEAWVTAATQKAFATGLQGTPTILIDGNVIQGTTADALLSAVS